MPVFTGIHSHGLSRPIFECGSEQAIFDLPDLGSPRGVRAWESTVGLFPPRGVELHRTMTGSCKERGHRLLNSDSFSISLQVITYLTSTFPNGQLLSLTSLKKCNHGIRLNPEHEQHEKSEGNIWHESTSTKSAIRSDSRSD